MVDTWTTGPSEKGLPEGTLLESFISLKERYWRMETMKGTEGNKRRSTYLLSLHSFFSLTFNHFRRRKRLR